MPHDTYRGSPVLYLRAALAPGSPKICVVNQLEIMLRYLTLQENRPYIALLQLVTLADNSIAI